jgi:phage-related protein
MTVRPSLKPVIWIGSSRRDFRALPDAVKSRMGYALHVAQQGGKHRDAKPLKGFGGAGVVEIVTDFDGDTFRAVYTVRIAGAVHVLHVFQKKSKKGRATPKTEMDLVESDGARRNGLREESWDEEEGRI